jgi:hypothetical protein
MCDLDTLPSEKFQTVNVISSDIKHLTDRRSHIAHAFEAGPANKNSSRRIDPKPETIDLSCQCRSIFRFVRCPSDKSKVSIKDRLSAGLILIWLSWSPILPVQPLRLLGSKRFQLPILALLQ